jgi:hypothetical protein
LTAFSSFFDTEKKIVVVLRGGGGGGVRSKSLSNCFVVGLEGKKWNSDHLLHTPLIDSILIG